MDGSSRTDQSQRLRPEPEETEVICRLVVDKSPLPLLVIDGESLGIVAANDAASRCYGYSSEELTRLSARELRAENDSQTVFDFVTSASRVEPIVWTERHRRRDGSVFDVDAKLHAVRYAGRDAWLAIVADVATAAEAHVEPSEPCEMPTLFASRLAHDVNTFLTIVQLEAERLRRARTAVPSHASGIANIEIAAHHAATLTRQIVELASPRAASPRALALNTIIVDMLPMLVRLVGDSITTRTTLEAELGTVVADRSQLERVILNLVSNARDAMPRGGSLWIETRSVELDCERVRELHVAPGPYVALAIVDDGTGMDATTAARIFEPFFTTKATGVGTGLGLSTVASIVRASDGAVDVRTETDRGTKFTVYLPCRRRWASARCT